MNTKRIEKPYLCGGYTIEDWNILNGGNIDVDLYEDLDICFEDDPIGYDIALMEATKPIWAQRR